MQQSNKPEVQPFAHIPRTSISGRVAQGELSLAQDNLMDSDSQEPPQQQPSQGWDGEPTTLDELTGRYESVMECPARNPHAQLKLVHATEKGKEAAENVSPGQQHKLFLVDTSIAFIFMTTPNLESPSPEVSQPFLRLPHRTSSSARTTSSLHMIEPPS